MQSPALTVRGWASHTVAMDYANNRGATVTNKISGCLFCVIIYVLVFMWMMALMMLSLSAQERFGAGAIWEHHTLSSGDVVSFENENACWHFHFSQDDLSGSFCEPDKEWALIESTQFGISTSGFKSELGCFMSGIIASHEQGVEAQCMYLGDVARR
jgi:hypothetical protein